MRILYSSFTFFPELNGQAVFTLNLVCEMAALGHEVLVLTQNSGKKAEEINDPRIKVIHFPSIPLKAIHKDLRVAVFSRKAIRQVFSDFQPDLVHVQDPSLLSQAIMRVAHHKHVPVLATHHTGPEITAPYLNPKNPVVKKYLHTILWQFLRLHLNNADTIAVPSKFSKRMLSQHKVQPEISVIGCGINLEHFLPATDDCQSQILKQHGLNPEKVLALYVGRLDFEKNVDVLIQAMAILDHRGVQLGIVGQGNKEIQYRNLVKTLGLEDQIIFVGQLNNPELPQLLNSADIFIMPGAGESFSIATLEAMACAKPVIAANSAALPELVESGKNGLLFNPTSAEELAGAIRTLADDIDAREEMGATGYFKVRNYSLLHMAQAYEQTYRTCIETANLPQPHKAAEKHSIAWLLQPLKIQKMVLPRQLIISLIGLFIFLLSIFIYDQAQARPNLQIDDLETLEFSTPTRLLVIAPHPDDEILAAGGLIQNVLANQGEVKVVIATNGDGEVLGPLMVNPLSLPKANNYVGLGEYRQKEAGLALQSLGVDPGDVVFLGYPDRMLSKFWESDWSNTQPLKAVYTRLERSPYPNTYNKEAVYCGKDLINDLQGIILGFQPDLILVPHPEDTHPDHTALSDFSRYAIAQSLATGDLPKPMVMTYLVHYQGYPLLKNKNSNIYLLPPSALANRGKDWYTHALSPTEKARKQYALGKYTSQVRASGYYLNSFVRNNEIFFDLPIIHLPIIGFEVDETLENSLLKTNTDFEPKQERAARAFFSSTDLISSHVVRFNNLVCYGAGIRGPASNEVNYIIRAKLPDGSNLQVSQPEDMIWLTNYFFSTCFKLDEMKDVSSIGFSAETRYDNELMDQTIWRFVNLNPEPPENEE